MGSRDFVIANARVFDGEHVHARASVLVTNGRIEQVGPDVHPPAGTKVIDGTPRWATQARA
jgi:imidazolonepropionase-like amidohydrolase